MTNDKTLDLGPLKFKSEDFEVLLAGTQFRLAVHFAERANEVLRQRLANAQEVFCRKNTWSDGTIALWSNNESDERFAKTTHSARLVCVKALKSERGE